jgi:hypothetical protein
MLDALREQARVEQGRDPSNSSMLAARAKRCTVLRSSRSVRDIEIDVSTCRRCCTAVYCSRVRIIRWLSVGALAGSSVVGLAGAGVGAPVSGSGSTRLRR